MKDNRQSQLITSSAVSTTVAVFLILAGTIAVLLGAL